MDETNDHKEGIIIVLVGLDVRSITRSRITASVMEKG